MLPNNNVKNILVAKIVIITVHSICSDKSIHCTILPSWSSAMYTEACVLCCLYQKIRWLHVYVCVVWSGILNLNAVVLCTMWLEICLDLFYSLPANDSMVTTIWAWFYCVTNCFPCQHFNNRIQLPYNVKTVQHEPSSQKDSHSHYGNSLRKPFIISLHLSTIAIVNR